MGIFVEVLAFRDVRATDSMYSEECVTVALDDSGHIVGLEILGASERLVIGTLVDINIENMFVSWSSSGGYYGMAAPA